MLRNTFINEGSSRAQRHAGAGSGSHIVSGASLGVSKVPQERPVCNCESDLIRRERIQAGRTIWSPMQQLRTDKTPKYEK